ncbi:hypothetical protein [Aquisalinus flavus]|uniref:Uncharacterized protein n=1 Tax=Aquisalinus flavus TaxID=1526572 RepID=A0A8J2Y7V3_9PROT|nr:hypothetical protein [Aquisalinus flavus]MBD0426512.1 hypothetical protein [Aquisalinus flavus]UNE47936.1 hypothetical protein FF099_07690 [Aquisalinus flavus]GGD07360.1 hypothetical protein GCM10011342_15220 [Aquisalinus flavus]
MKTIITTSLAIFSLAALTACGGGNDGEASDINITAEQADGPKDYVAVYEKQLITIADAVEAVTDEQSAQVAAQVIRDASAELEIIAKKAETMSQIEQARFAMSFTTELADTQMRLMGAMQRLYQTDPETMQLISDAMEDLPSPVEQ